MIVHFLRMFEELVREYFHCQSLRIKKQKFVVFGEIQFENMFTIDCCDESIVFSIEIFFEFNF